MSSGPPASARVSERIQPASRGMPTRVGSPTPHVGQTPTPTATRARSSRTPWNRPWNGLSHTGERSVERSGRKWPHAVDRPPPRRVPPHAGPAPLPAPNVVLGSIAGALLLEATVRSGTKARRSVAPLPLHTRPSAQEGEKLGASGRSWPDAIAGACAARACPALRSCREASAVTGAARAIVSWGGLRRRWVRAATEDRA